MASGKSGVESLESRWMLAGDPMVFRALGSVGADEVVAIVADGAGNILVAGNFTKTLALGTRTAPASVSSAGGQDGFVASYSPVGKLNWAFSVGGASTDRIAGLAMNPDGTFCITGTFIGVANFAPGSTAGRLKSAGNSDIFVARYSAAGAFQWVRQMGGTSSDDAMAIAVDKDGNVLTTGSFDHRSDFDPGRGYAWLEGGYTNDVFVSKLSSNGKLVWAQRIDNWQGNDEGRAIDSDDAGNVYVAGYMTTEWKMVKLGVVSELHNAFEAKFAPDGKPVWEQRYLGGGDDMANGLVVDGAGNSYLTGVMRQNLYAASTAILKASGDTDAFLIKVTPTGGYAWATTLGGTGADRGETIALAGNGNVVCGGSFAGTADFLPGRRASTLTSYGGTDAFVASYTPGGAMVSARRFGGAGSETVLAVSAKGSNTLLGGTFTGTASFGSPLATIMVKSAGNTDGWWMELEV